jgi:hypothetical protein
MPTRSPFEHPERTRDRAADDYVRLLILCGFLLVIAAVSLASLGGLG